jgi:hypothetical protein
MNDPSFTEPQPMHHVLYKTAWSDTYNSYVEIIHVHKDDSGEPIITCRVPGKSEQVLFRVCELSEWCL